MPTAARAHGWHLWVAMAVIYLVWGSTYFGIAIAIRTIPPFFTPFNPGQLVFDFEFSRPTP